MLLMLLFWAIVLVPAFIRPNDWRSEVARNHPITVAGIPIAGCTSFLVIAFYGAVAGPIKISIWGIQIEGAGGPVIIWVICLLALAFAARLTWPLKP